MKKKYTATEVRTLILDSATQLFATNGFEQTKVQDIMNPYLHHTKSKEIVDEISKFQGEK